MFRTPLKNSKNVNKPFKSPFDTSTTPNKELTKSGQKPGRLSFVSESPVSLRAHEAKRVLQLDDSELDNKRSKLTRYDSDGIEKIVPENATKSDLLLLKRKIFEIRQELDCLKSRERCSKKHDPKVLRASIDRWQSACQSALEIVCSELTERNGQSSNISDVLSMLGIPEELVHYSKKDDAFI
ncbi:uncharacterized protein LOC106644527 [Copidosoma floridanum]|uniref:uncharacterized protein LOC106644527 n=1 Tax=Copidosoma floridanum TaxID=29053 RepID=UPI0006C98293|nr:uncharacterized protein LOC106644527 [Copidosoma floridanum]